MGNKLKINFYAGFFLLCCTVIFSVLACKKTKDEDPQTFVTDISSLFSGGNTTPPSSEEIAKVVEQAIYDRIRGRDMGIGSPELELVDSENNIFTYKGTVPSYSSMYTINHEITVVYDGKVVVYSFDDNPDYKVTIKPKIVKRR